MHKSKTAAALFIALALCVALSAGVAAYADDAEGKCTQFYMGKDTTDSGSYLWGRSEDISARYAKLLTVKPAMTYEPGTVYYSGYNNFTWVYPESTFRYIMCKDSDKANGPYDTDEVYAEVGMNEMGVAISASVTLGGTKNTILAIDPMVRNTGMEESDIVSIVLMSATSARHGCELLAEVYDAKGAQSRDGVMISDPNEVWYFNVLSGHQYIAVKCPDDMVGLSPNLTGNLIGAGGYTDVSDADNVIVSQDFINVPKTAGELVADGDNENLVKVADTYASILSNHQGGRLRVGYGYLYGYTTNAEVTANLPGTKYMDFFVEPREGYKYSLYDAMRLLACRGEGTEWEQVNPTGNSSSIGNANTLESHVFEVRQNMPPDLATVEWIGMGPAEFSVYLPFYGNLVTDTIEEYYTLDASSYNNANPDANNVYWVFRELYAQCAGTTAADRARWGDGVKAFWEAYQKSLIEQQANVDAFMLDVLNKYGTECAQEAATELSMKISEDVYGYAKQILAELKAFKTAGTAGDFIPSLLGTPAETANYAPTIVEITGPDYVVSGPGATASYTVSVKNMPKVSGIELEFIIDGSFLTGLDFNAVGMSIIGDGNYGSPVYWRNDGDYWIGKVTLANPDGICGDADIFTMDFGVVENVIGVSNVNINYILLSYGGNYVILEDLFGVASTEFGQYYSKYDVNRSGAVDLNDLTYALMYFMVKSGDAGWDAAEAIDFNGDGIIDVADLVLILANYTIPYYS